MVARDDGATHDGATDDGANQVAVTQDTATHDTATQDTGPARGAKPLRRVLLWLALASSALVVVLALLLGWLVSTESGARLAWDRALVEARARGIELTGEGPGGRLWDGLSFDRLGLRVVPPGPESAMAVTAEAAATEMTPQAHPDPEIRLDFDGLTLGWSLVDLWEGRLSLAPLRARSLRVALPPGEDGETDLEQLPVPMVPDLALPVVVRVEGFELADLTVSQGGKPLFRGAVRGAVALDERGLSIQTLEVNTDGANARVAGHLGLVPGASLDLEAQWDARAVLAGAGTSQTLSGVLNLSGTLDRITLRHRLSSPWPMELSGTVEPALSWAARNTGDPAPGWAPGFDLALNWSGPLAGGPLPAPWVLGPGGLSLVGDPRGAELRWSVPVSGDAAGTALDLETRLHGQLDQSGLVIHSFEVEERAATEAAGPVPGTITLDGALAWDGPPSANLELHIEEFDPARLAPDWPGRLNAELALSVKLADGGGDGGYAMAGDLRRLGGTLRGYPLAGGGRWSWEKGVLSVEDLNLASGANRLNAAGRVAGLVAGLERRPGHDGGVLSGALEGALTLPEPDALVPGASGSLAARFKLDARGDQLKAEVRAEAPRFAWHGAGAQAASSQVPEAGPGVVDLPGPDRVGRTGADRVELAGAELALDWRGPVDAPHRGRGSLRVQARSLGLIDAAATDIDARVEGGWDRHRIALRALLSGADTSLAVESAAEGGWPGLNDLSEAGQRPWLGRVTGLTLDGPLLGTWALRDAVAVRASMSEFALDEMCLDRSPAGLCATVGWTARGAPRADVTLRDLPSGWLERAANEAGGIGLPEGVSLSTRLGADVRVRGEDLSLVLLPGQGVVTLKEPPLDLPGRLPFRIEAASFHRESGKSRAAVDLDLERFGRAQAVVTLSPRGGTQALGGRVTARSSDLSWLSAAVPQLTRLQGGMDLDIALGGTLERPAVGPSGVLRVERARLPDAGIDLTDLVLDFKPVPGSGKGERGKTGGLPDVLLNGGAELAAPLTPGRAWSGPGVASGRLRIEGRLAGDGESVSLRVQGGPVPVMRLPDVSLDVAPDLLFRSEGGARVLEGTLRVPHGLYQATALPAGSVRVSGDELIVGEDATPNPASDDGPGPGSTPESTPLAGLRASLDIELGDDVRIDAFDLKARLGGRMNVRVREGRESAEGRIDLIEGRYKAYGQDLTLSRGFLLFSGPADDPSLDLRAKRTSVDGKTTAYLDVSGTLRAPRFAVSTEPAGSDADALAYLLTGRPLAGAGKGEKFDIYAAALGLGLDKGEPLFADVRRELGLDELQLSSGMRLQDTALSLGKYVNPDLFVGYSINLFDRAGAVLLRLRLTDALSVEGRSGQSQSLDLIYTIESR